jgi:hypothetical protein
MDTLKKDFEDNFFGIEIIGFSRPMHFSEKEVGISIRKDYETGYTSSIKIGILQPTKEIVQQLYICVTYGKLSEESLTLREKTSLTDPIDLVSSVNDIRRYFYVHSVYPKDKYYYNKQSNIFLRNNKEISPLDLVDELYKKHIKSTLIVRGFILRLNILFWQIAVPHILSLIYKLLHHILSFISGDRYTYNIFKEHGETSNQHFNEPLPNWGTVPLHAKKLQVKDEESEKIKILAYKASKRAVITYSLINLAIYLFIFFYMNKVFQIMKQLLDNNLISLFYVIVTLWFFDTILPKLLKYTIDNVTKLAYHFAYKPIGV